MLVALVVGAHGWDDGAITLAFARTFADTGHIALTPVSVTVEGSSSPFWFALLAATHAVLSPGFYGFITASQLWSGVFTTVTALLAYALLVPRLGRGAAWLSCAAIFVSAPFLNETMNGMEMSALAAVAVLLALLVDQRRDRFRWAVFAVAFVGPVVRFEAAGYLLAAAAGMILFSRYARTAAAIAAGAVSSVVFLSAGRLIVFGGWLPNTIRAKRWAPYSSQSLMGKLHSTLSVAVETVLLFAPELAFATVLALLCWPLFKWRRDWLPRPSEPAAFRRSSPSPRRTSRRSWRSTC
jgi:hypothetical protein